MLLVVLQVLVPAPRRCRGCSSNAARASASLTDRSPKLHAVHRARAADRLPRCTTSAFVGERAVRLAQVIFKYLPRRGTAQHPVPVSAALELGGTGQVPAQRTGIDHAHRPHGAAHGMWSAIPARTHFHPAQFGHGPSTTCG